MNITDVIWRNSHAWPDQLAVLQDGHRCTYKTLRQVVELGSARLAVMARRVRISDARADAR